MEDNEMAVQLLRGSCEIDRMRKDINQFMRMVLGLVSASAESMPVPSSGMEMVIYRSPTCVWRMQIASVKDGLGSFFQRTKIYCDLPSYDDPSNESLATHYMFAPTRYDGLRAENVRRVYESLPKFLEGMLSTFPELRKRVKPFVEEGKRPVSRVESV